MMDNVISSDDSCDSEVKNLKNQLIEYGLEDENLSKEEMTDLLKALNNSKSSVKEDDLLRQQAEQAEPSESPKQSMKRKYLNVRDRRMPWSLFSSTITQAEKARTLAVYIKLMSINNYRQARQSAVFAAWPPPIQIVEETTRVQPLRSTRSGRSVPIYSGFDDDSSDLDFIVTKPKKRKVSNSDSNANDGIFANKVVSLKRKSSKDDPGRSVKEQKLMEGKVESTINSKNKKDFLTIIED